MKKKNTPTDQYSQALQNLKEKKELLPLHKMDDVSRRKFIQTVGYFLGALGVSPFIRLEKMSDLSRKIFGNSEAYAAGFASGPLDLIFFTRAGHANRWTVGIYGDDTTLSPAATVPWSTGITSTATSGLPVILPPNAQSLLPFVGGIQHVMGLNQTGHTNAFQTTHVSLKGNLLAWRAATEGASSNTLLKSPFAFGDARNNVSLQDLPVSISEYTPLQFSTISDAYSMFSPATFKSPEGTTLSSSLRDQLLATIGNRFQDKITKGVLQKNAALTTDANKQSIKILATNYQNELNPNHADNTAIMSALTAGLGSQGNYSIGSMNPAQCAFVAIRAALLGITPMVAGFSGVSTDWHAFNTLPSGTGSSDLRYTTGKYFADLIANICTAASSGLFLNPVTGNPQEIRVLMVSEFNRTFNVLNGDNGDGGSSGGLIISSKASQTAFTPGCFGGANSSGVALGFDPVTKTHATNIPLLSPGTLLGHNLNLLKVDRELVGLQTYTGFTGNLA